MKKKVDQAKMPGRMPRDGYLSVFADYEPAHFADVYKEIGRELALFLTDHDSILRAETATELRRPPAEALARTLLARLGERVRPLRVRQLFGHMVRHMMEKRGYVLDQEEVRISEPVLFTRAARYRRCN
jgi:hypothetical protein